MAPNCLYQEGAHVTVVGLKRKMQLLMHATPYGHCPTLKKKKNKATTHLIRLGLLRELEIVLNVW